MPKVATQSTSSARPEGPHPLKRNQACHQCRRRKLKCDAKRPACTTCLRSWNHAVAHAAPGTKAQLPEAPECTFDDVVDVPIVNEASKTRYEKLESRIHELEALLLEKEMGSSNSTPPIHQSPSEFLGGTVNVLSSQSPPFDHFISPAVNLITPGGSPNSSSGREILGNYPPGLPNPDVLQHLVSVFFVFHPHANRVLHFPSFMATLSLSPSHPKYPSPPLLHAICALGSLYTAAVSSPPLPNFSEVDPDEIFSERHRIREGRPDSFAEEQAKLAQKTADHFVSLGDRLFETLQGNPRYPYVVLLVPFQIFISSSNCLRVAVPLGFNVCPPFHSISHSLRPSSIIQPANTVCATLYRRVWRQPLLASIEGDLAANLRYASLYMPVVEDETRRNVFWLTYATERLHGCGNGWALSLDDQDISQLLPVRGDQYEQGMLVTPPDRQWAHTRDLLLLHPEKQTDSFVLYIKGTILLSKVKTFNLRFRAQYFFGDVSVMSPHTEQYNRSVDPIDPRGSPAFLEIDNIAASFRSSFPAHLRNPIVGQSVDQHLYAACLMPHIAMILLHDPHADVRRKGCVSALKIITAARAVLDLIYEVCSTSFDVTLLDPFCSYCWFIAGRVLVRFLQAAMDINATDQIATLRAELDFFELAISKIGQRIPLAFRYAKMLRDLVLKCCGASQENAVQLSFPRPLEFDLEKYFHESIGFPGNLLHESLGLQGNAGSFMAAS